MPRYIDHNILSIPRSKDVFTQVVHFLVGYYKDDDFVVINTYDELTDALKYRDFLMGSHPEPIVVLEYKTQLFYVI